VLYVEPFFVDPFELETFGTVDLLEAPPLNPEEVELPDPLVLVE
jgi:hypothetical protein